MFFFIIDFAVNLFGICCKAIEFETKLLKLHFYYFPWKAKGRTNMDLQLQNNFLLKEITSQQQNMYRPKSPGRFFTGNLNNNTSTQQQASQHLAQPNNKVIKFFQLRN